MKRTTKQMKNELEKLQYVVEYAKEKGDAEGIILEYIEKTIKEIIEKKETKKMRQWTTTRKENNRKNERNSEKKRRKYPKGIFRKKR